LIDWGNWVDKPLCPDACSGFILHDPKRVEHNREVKLATKALYNSVIPSVATLLTEERFIPSLTWVSRCVRFAS